MKTASNSKIEISKEDAQKLVEAFDRGIQVELDLWEKVEKYKFYKFNELFEEKRAKLKSHLLKHPSYLKYFEKVILISKISNNYARQRAIAKLVKDYTKMFKGVNSNASISQFEVARILAELSLPRSFDFRHDQLFEYSFPIPEPTQTGVVLTHIVEPPFTAPVFTYLGVDEGLLDDISADGNNATGEINVEGTHNMALRPGLCKAAVGSFINVPSEYTSVNVTAVIDVLDFKFRVISASDDFDYSTAQGSVYFIFSGLNGFIYSGRDSIGLASTVGPGDITVDGSGEYTLVGSFNIPSAMLNSYMIRGGVECVWHNSHLAVSFARINAIVKSITVEMMP